MVLETITNCQHPQLVLAFLCLLEKNIQEVVLAKSAKNNYSKAWFIDHFTKPDVRKEIFEDLFTKTTFQDLILTTAHSADYLLAKLEVMRKATRRDVLECPASVIRGSKSAKLIALFCATLLCSSTITSSLLNQWK